MAARGTLAGEAWELEVALVVVVRADLVHEQSVAVVQELSQSVVAAVVGVVRVVAVATAAEDSGEVQRGLLLDTVAREGAAVLQLFASKHEALLVGRNAFPTPELHLQVRRLASQLGVESHGPARQGSHEDLLGLENSLGSKRVWQAIWFWFRF